MPLRCIRCVLNTAILKKPARNFFICLVLSFLSFQSYGQCEVLGTQVIPDDGILTVDFHISGLADNDLSSPTQGVCAVEIDFMHEYLGDLTISLISPSGTRIELVGPVTTATSNTNLTRWNVTFIPCMTPAMPDAGFADTWSNGQLWQSSGFYSGEYYPSAGCLEDFNTGPANGNWQVLLEDHDIFQTGSVSRISIIFCNPGGLQCIECGADAGLLSPLSITSCAGETIQTDDITVDYAGVVPSPDEYNYAFLLLSGNTILKSGSSFSESPLPGTYTICGLSYLTSELNVVSALLAVGDYSQVLQAVNGGNICGNLSSPCVTYTVMPPPDTVITDAILCREGAYVFRGQLYNAPGIYYAVEDGQGICDSIFRLNLQASNLIAEIAVPDSISCNGIGVVLNGSLSQGNGNMTFEWTTVSGILNGNTASNQVVALVPGTYKLTVRDGICEVSKEVVVYGDITYPKLFLKGGILTCIQPSITLKPVVIPSNVTYAWTGPGGFSSNSQNITVSNPGRYFIRVTSPNGCEIFNYVDVISDQEAPDATIQLFDKVCQSGFGVIGTNTTDLMYNWTGPNGYISTNPVIGITSTGEYLLTVTNPGNGCMSTSTYTYVADFDLPQIIISGLDSLRCNANVELSINPAGISPSPHWTGPNGFVVGGFDVTLIQPGQYIVQVLGFNGCRNFDTVEIVPAHDFPLFTTVNDTISCFDNNASIGINMPGGDLYQWSGIAPPQGANAFVQVALPGTYYVTAIDTNSGCSIEATAQVFGDLSPPVYTFIADTISCKHQIASLAFVGQPGHAYLSTQWQLPDLSVVTDEELLTDQPGKYLLTVTGINGCIDTTFVNVGVDTIAPLFFLEGDTIGCDHAGQINSILVDSLTDLSWIGPSGFISDDLDPMIPDTGLYIATGTGINGCVSSVPVRIQGDFEPPASMLELDTVICSPAFAHFVAHSSEKILSYKWYDDAGNLIGTDSTLKVNRSGSYKVQLEGNNHCISFDSIILDAAYFPAIIIDMDTFSCTVKSMTLDVSSDIPAPNIFWIDLDGDTLSQSGLLDITTPGPYIVSITGNIGCEVRDTILIPTDTLAPFANIVLHGEVRCQNIDFMLEAISVSNPVSFEWTSVGGLITSDPALALIDARDTGVYIVSVLDLDNGCVSIDSIIISEHEDAITGVLLDIAFPACSGDSNGIIEITGLTGGVQPLLYQINDGPAQSDDIFEGLKSGNYLLQVTDAAGCFFDTLITLDTSEPYTVDAGPDQEILLGESVVLTGETDIDPENIFAEEWAIAGLVFCMDCTGTTVGPLTTTTYSYAVTSLTGCVEKDDVTVFVDESVKYYISNVFTPNGDGVNDEIRIYPSPGIARLLKWTIFDRWGNSIFNKTDFDPLDATVFWDGTSSGSDPLNPGVFTFVLELELKNGIREVNHGTITLLR